MNRIAMLDMWADFYVEHGHWPDLSFYLNQADGCEMVMVSANGNKLDFTAHYPDITIAVFRQRPIKEEGKDADDTDAQSPA